MLNSTIFSTNLTTNTSYACSGNRNTPHLIDLVFAWFTICSWIATFIFNGLIIWVYFKELSLRTPFNAYIVNLCITEVVLAVTADPLNFLLTYYGYWPFDTVSCGVLAYSRQLFGSIVRYGHLHVTGNRLWAVTLPVSYKERHTQRVANGVIILTWIFLHALHLPVIIPGLMWPLVGECFINTSFQYKTALVAQMLGYVVPEIMILLLCPYIFYKIAKRRKHVIMPHSSANIPSVPNKGTKTEHTDMKPAVHRLNKLRVHTNNSAKVGRLPRKISSHDRLLVFFFVTVLLFWTPNHIYYSLLTVQVGFSNSTYFVVQYFLALSNSWINPILYCIALQNFRAAIWKLTCSCFVHK